MGVAAIPYVAMAAAAALQYDNTQRTARRQDSAAADAIRHQSGIQRQADARVGETVQRLAGSSSAASEKVRLDDYMQVLRRNKGTVQAGLAPVIGSEAFKTDSAAAANDAQSYAQKTAGLMARMDAPGMQRQQEGFDYGKLATDLGLIGRDSQGQAFLDQVRMNGIRRSAKKDLAAGLLNAYAGAAAGGASPQSYGYGSGTPMVGSTTAAGGGYVYNLPF